MIADTRRALRVPATSHPPVYGVPFDDVRPGVLEPAGADRRPFCEFKGMAPCRSVVAGGQRSPEAGWSYPDPDPPPGREAGRGHVAFPRRARAQPGSFSGGRVAAPIRGPFKGRVRYDELAGG